MNSDIDLNKIKLFSHWNMGLGFLDKKGLMAPRENTDVINSWRHKFVLCMSKFLFHKEMGVNDPVMEFRLAKEKLLEVFGEEIQNDEISNDIINTRLKSAQLLYRGEINWIEDKQRLSFGLNKTKVDKLYKETIDQEGGLADIYQIRKRPPTYQKSLDETKKQIFGNRLERLKKIKYLELLDPIVHKRLYLSIINDPLYDEENIEQQYLEDRDPTEIEQMYKEEIMAERTPEECVLMNYEEIFDQETGKQIDFEEPTWDDKYSKCNFAICNQVTHHKVSLEYFEYTDVGIDQEIFPYCFPCPPQFPIPQHELVRDLFYSVRQTIHGRPVFREGYENVPKKQLRTRIDSSFGWKKLQVYLGHLTAYFPHYKATDKESILNNEDNCYDGVKSKYSRIPILGDESFDMDEREY